MTWVISRVGSRDAPSEVPGAHGASVDLDGAEALFLCFLAERGPLPAVVPALPAAVCRGPNVGLTT